MVLRLKPHFLRDRLSASLFLRASVEHELSPHIPAPSDKLFRDTQWTIVSRAHLRSAPSAKQVQGGRRDPGITPSGAWLTEPHGLNQKTHSPSLPLLIPPAVA